MGKEETSGYSLIMRGFQGKYRIFQEAAERAFERRGISAVSLCLDKNCLPTEIAKGLDFEAAIRIRTLLEETGASVDVVPTQELPDVRFHAEDCWPSRAAGDWRFTEVDNLILTLEPLNARTNVRHVKERSPSALPWEIEAGVNHQHPTYDYSRQALRAAREMGADVAEALHVAYPERRFILEFLEEQMSFYQAGDGVPTEDLPPSDPLPETAFCERCEGNRPYRLRLLPDLEFPRADWGDCLDCDSEILLRTWRIREAI